MKKTILAAAAFAAMGLSSSVMAADLSESFQWAGSIPMASDTTQSVYIVPALETSDFQKGTLTFSHDGTDATLTGSSVLSFKVLRDTDGNGSVSADDTAPTGTFDYTLTTIKVGTEGGIATEQDGVFKILANGQDLVKGTKNTSTAGSDVISLTVGDAGQVNTLPAGSDVVVRALLAVSATNA